MYNYLGLKLRCGRETKSFSYINLERPGLVEWKYISGENVNRDHIRVHQLQADDDISNLFDDFRQEYTKAVVLINCEDDLSRPYNLPEDTKRVPFPLIMVKKSDGEKILGFMSKGQDTHACMGTSVLSEGLESPVDSAEMYPEHSTSKVII